MSSSDESLTRVDKAEKSGDLSGSAAAEIRRWLTEEPFAAYRSLLERDIEQAKWKTLDDAFYAVLEFGTGGRRGKMYPVGTNVLNERTMAESARGLADYVLKTKGEATPKSCVIARDTRHNSPEFAAVCARVLAAAGFKVYLFPEPRSTPLLSTAVRHLKCDAGIMITASHNAPQDNGFKCYAANGGQVIAPDDAGIIACVKLASERVIPLEDLDEAIKAGTIVLVGEAEDKFYIDSVLNESVSVARDLSLVYTPMHGVGESSVAAALKAAGFSKVNVLASQRSPDGDFPNVPGHVSNPEIPKTLDASIQEARSTGALLVLASDPDADRIGVGLPVTGDPAGEWTTLDGNQIGALLTAFVIRQTSAMGQLRDDHYIVTTMVSSQMARAIAVRHGVKCEDDLLVGFKYIGQRIDEMGPAGFLFGFEESHGYLKGTYARDKDAAVAAFLFAELAAQLKDRQQTVLEYLDYLYLDVGYYGERLINKTLEGREGVAQIKALMEAFRTRPPKEVAGLAVTEVYDYKTHEVRDARDGKVTPLPQPSGDLLIFHLDAPGVRFAVRPSGTEPKIKFYLFARGETRDLNDLAQLVPVKAETSKLMARMAADLDQFVATVVGKP
ncbi:phospho-sugar mutase [Isosphaeraceae bacterium EP7]